MPQTKPPASERALAARVAAQSRWAHVDNRTAATAAGRLAFEQKFVDDVDPGRELPDGERSYRAASARAAYFSRLALRSASSRRRAKDLLADAQAADLEVAVLADES